MTKLTLHPIIERMQGKIGDLVFRKAHTGEMTVIRRADMSGVKWSTAQKKHRRRFKEAVSYARAAMQVPEVRALYVEKAREKNKRPFDMAVSDYFQGNDLLAKK